MNSLLVEKSSEKLLERKEKIDKIDEQLLGLFSERFKIVLEIGKQKKKQNIPPLDNIRWKKVLKRMLERGQELGLSKAFIEDIWERIHKESLNIEE